MNQFLLGASFPFIVACIVYAARRFRAGLVMLVGTPAAMALCGLWAIVPDLPRVIGWHSLYSRLAQDPRTNVFFWHYAIDRVEQDSIWFNVLFLLMFASLLAAAWREVRRAEEP